MSDKFFVFLLNWDHEGDLLTAIVDVVDVAAGSCAGESRLACS